jgi:hypothetical protein
MLLTPIKPTKPIYIYLYATIPSIPYTRRRDDAGRPYDQNHRLS